MASGRKNKTKPQISLKTEKNRQDQNPSATELNQVEFHRHGLALVPDPSDRKPGVTFFLKGNGNQPDLRICSCSTSRRETCPHILKLVKLYRALQKEFEGRSAQDAFRSSIWYRLATILADGGQETTISVRLQFVDMESGRALRVLGSDGQEMLSYLSKLPDAIRFLERLGQVPKENAVPHRGALLEELARMTLSEAEYIMGESGAKTIRRVLEESFWHRFAYHGFREFGDKGISFFPSIEEASGKFTVICRRFENDPIFHMVIPRGKVKSLLRAFKEFLPNQHGLSIHPIPLKSIFKISINTELDLEVRPIIKVLQESGETRFFEREDLERFRYGDLVYIRELGILAELEPPGEMPRKFAAPVRMVLKKSQVPSFLQELGDKLKDGPHIIDASVKSLKIYKQFERVEITPGALDRDWCWLSVRYDFGNSSISLAEILRAKKEGQRFVPTADGWVDCQSQDFEGLDPDQFSVEPLANPSNQLKLSRMDLLRLKVTNRRSLQVTGDDKMASLLIRMLDLKPAKPLPELDGMTSPLRPYQKLGVEWLLFLFENGLGGLLCDDMGMGKTHQVMALMLLLGKHMGVKGPFLVVCPTTVLSHWRGKIFDHARGLKAAVFHGGERDLEDTLKDNDVVLTSYGILRNDIEQLKQIPFSLAVFDEIQNIKNPETLAYEAARNLKATIKLGVTGTPIENRLTEMKALFDLTVPGYFGTDEDFAARYVKPIEEDLTSSKREALARLISPFTLRRLKRTVLDELPEKIEDIRMCSLSEDQTRLYRDAISSRGEGLIEALKRGKEPIPYIHIFALLNLLKQICNHPALLESRVDDFDRYQSGKWDLFKEILSEAFDSGQKIVVYSQFLGMIRMIERFLQGQGMRFVTLTGATRNRGEIISRFNKDPDCRVYVGSLKAGGTGIDLVAASVVIHYDRWWNAAREDQATDRVHRIGQRRGVQVFKLVTEGTLEEKISAIIEKKRNLMDSIVREDDPGLLKTFSREDLIQILSAPS